MRGGLAQSFGAALGAKCLSLLFHRNLFEFHANLSPSPCNVAAPERSALGGSEELRRARRCGGAGRCLRLPRAAFPQVSAERSLHRESLRRVRGAVRSPGGREGRGWWWWWCRSSLSCWAGGIQVCKPDAVHLWQIVVAWFIVMMINFIFPWWFWRVSDCCYYYFFFFLLYLNNCRFRCVWLIFIFPSLGEWCDGCGAARCPAPWCAVPAAVTYNEPFLGASGSQLGLGFHRAERHCLLHVFQQSGAVRGNSHH